MMLKIGPVTVFISIYTYIVKSEQKQFCKLLNQILHLMSSSKSVLFSLSLIAPSDLQLPLRQWGAGNVYLLVLSKSKR